MPRYYFHLRDNRLLKDEEGSDLPDLEAARNEALRTAHTIIAESIRHEELQELRAIEIWDSNQLLDTVPFGSVYSEPAAMADAASRLDPDAPIETAGLAADQDDYD